MRRLFAEQFLIRPGERPLPLPASYDERRGVSLSADGSPFVESGAAHLDTHTMTFDHNEGNDSDQDRATPAALFTETRASGEQSDNPAWAFTETAKQESPDHAGLWAYTETKAHGESHDHAGPS